MDIITELNELLYAEEKLVVDKISTEMRYLKRNTKCG